MRLNPYAFNPASPASVAARLREALRQRRGFSLIRVGEGEATFLLPPDRSSIGDLARRLEYYWGHGEVSLDQWLELCAHLRQSICNADILCPPLPEQMRFKAQADDVFAPRYRQLAEYLGRLEFAELPLLTGAYINYALHADGTLFELLETEEEIGLVTSQPVAEALRGIFGLCVREYPIPRRAVDNERPENTGHFPGRYEDICAALRRDARGLLFLVGAGPLGKIYCDVVKQAGGIALDLGALLDAWAGFCTRPNHERRDSFGGLELLNLFPGGVDEDLLLTPQTVTRLTHGRLDKSRLRLMSPKIRISPCFTRKSAQVSVALRLLEKSDLFDAAWYIKRYARGRAAVIEPLEHYLRFGADKGYWPNPHFDTAWYRERRMRPEERDINPLLHYLLLGSGAGAFHV